MSHMLAVPALELGHPVGLVVLMKSGDAAVHGPCLVGVSWRLSIIKPGTAATRTACQAS